MGEPRTSACGYLAGKAEMNGHAEAIDTTMRSRCTPEIEPRSSPRNGINDAENLSPDVAFWSVSDVVTWVQTIEHLEGNAAMEIGTILQEQGVTGPVLLNLTDEQALELGISRFGVRKALLLAVQSLLDSDCKYIHIHRQTKNSTSPPKQQLITQPAAKSLRDHPPRLRHELPTTVFLENRDHAAASHTWPMTGHVDGRERVSVSPTTVHVEQREGVIASPSRPTSHEKKPYRVTVTAQPTKYTPVASEQTPMSRTMFTPISMPTMRYPGIQTARAGYPAPAANPVPPLKLPLSRGNSVLFHTNSVGSVTSMASRMNHSCSTSMLSTAPSFSKLPVLSTPCMRGVRLPNASLRTPQVFATRVSHQQQQLGMQRLVLPTRKESSSTMMDMSQRTFSLSQHARPVAGPA